MKNTFNLKITCILLLLVSYGINAQIKHEVVLNVDTAKITLANMEETCNFGQAPNVSNEDYTIKVAVGDIIIWSGVSSSDPSVDKVEITKILYSSGTNVLDERSIRDSNGVVTAEVKVGEVGDYEKYDIEFKVYRNGRVVRETFPIDPKLRIIARTR